MSEAFLRATKVTRRYRDGRQVRVAIDEVSFAIARGEWVALAGPSGSGKSTLLGLLGGIVTPTEGDVEVAGESLVSMREHHRARHRREHVGIVLQGLALVPKMTVLENVLLPLVPSGGASRADRARAIELLTRLGLGDRGLERAGTLSGGERQRTAIARALIRRAPALLLDEPTAHLDAETAGEVLSTLADLRDEGHAVVIASHDPRVLERPELSRVCRLDGGRLVER